MRRRRSVVAVLVCALCLTAGAVPVWSASAPWQELGTPAAKQPAASTEPTTTKGTSLTSFGAKCDGTTDDTAALQAAVAKAGTVTIPDSTCRIVSGGPIPLTSGVNLAGSGSKSTLALEGSGAWSALFGVQGEDISLSNFTMARASDVPGVFITLLGVSAFTMDRITIDGAKDKLGGTSEIHGIMIAGGAGVTNADIALVNSIIRGTDYGLFQDSGELSTTDGFVVDRCDFKTNYMDDLEFNAPASVMTNVKVTNSRFENNMAANPEVPYGFGVGVANVQQVLIKNNTFDNYPYLPVHIEDRSAFVEVSNNTFTNSFTEPIDYASHVFIVSGAHDVTVLRNHFDASANTNAFAAVYAGPGGAPAAPFNIRVEGNSFLPGPNSKLIGDYGAQNLTDQGNFNA